MKRADLLKEMKESIGTKDPIVFFEKMTDMFGLLFDHIDRLETHSALAIEWEPRVAADMLAKQIDVLRQDKDTYFVEITALKRAYAEDIITQNYNSFCVFWRETLGWHPFLDYRS